MKVFKAVAPYNLESSTRDGWALEQVLPSSHVDKMTCMTPIAVEGNNGSNGSYGSAGTVQMSSRDELVQINEPIFLLSKDVEEIKREEALAAQLREVNDKLKLAEEKHKLDARDLAVQKNQLDGLNSDLTNLRASLTTEEKARRKLETDLGRIRTAIGTTRYDEILSS